MVIVDVHELAIVSKQDGDYLCNNKEEKHKMKNGLFCMKIPSSLDWLINIVRTETTLQKLNKLEAEYIDTTRQSLNDAK